MKNLLSQRVGKPYTKVVFKPDYKRFGIPNGLSKNMIELLNRRIYDIAAVTDKKVVVRHNGMANGIKTFQQYVDLYIGGKDKTPRLYEEGTNDGNNVFVFHHLMNLRRFHL